MWFLFALIERSSSSWAEDRLSDQAALARIARGEHEALAELYDRHSRRVYSLALRIVQDRSEAEDVVQDVFTQAWTQAARYDTARGAVAAWLLNMARSRAIDRLRAKRARPDNTADENAGLNTPDPAIPADMQLLSSEQVTRLKSALQELPLLQRLALELAYYEGLTHTEIADRLEQPLGTVKTRIRQAVIRLRESLAGS
jgi:RNA polymerase sigma-70 factor, ECF subfamily